jgi:hypothetical protein
MISGEYYIVELSFNQRGFFVSLFSMEDQTKNKVLEIENIEKSNLILNSFNHDYETLTDHIKIVKGKIKIRRP